jgi:DNA recombination-dependent growth factor C
MLRQKITSEEYGNELVDRLIGKSKNIENVDFGNDDILNMVVSDFETELKNIIFEDVILENNEKSSNEVDLDNYVADIEEMLELELEELMDIIEIRLEELGYES